MKRSQLILALVMLAPLCVAGQQKSKEKSGLPAVFSHAQYVYVQAQDGDITRPNLYPEDRQAIADVEDGVRDWKRYSITIRKEEADLIFIVRKGRAASVQGRVGISGGTQAPRQAGQPGQAGQAGQDPRQDPGGNSVGMGTEFGPSDDLLEVYMTNPDGRLVGPLWMREMAEGLDGPSVPLLRQLRAEVERSYPNPPPQQKP